MLLNRNDLLIVANVNEVEPKGDFTIGIVDDVTFKSLAIKNEISIVKPGTTECKFYGLGSDGTVGAEGVVELVGTVSGTFSTYWSAEYCEKSMTLTR